MKGSTMKKIYIAGPYTGDEEANTERMIVVYRNLIKMGFAPFCPLLSHYAAGERWGDNYSKETHVFYRDWMRLDIAWLLQCDALFFMGSSPGADMERMVAEAMGIPVYESYDEIEDL